MSDASYVIPPPPQAALAVAGTAQDVSGAPHLVRRPQLLEHIKEMGQDEREPPFFFAKPADAIVPDGGTVPYPSLTKDLHHEVELVVALKSGGRNIPTDKALDCIWGYGVGIDLTRRDLQIASRDIKRPWEIGKAFDALGAVRAARAGVRDRPSDEGPHHAQGATARCARTAISTQMIWNVPEIISKLSEMVELDAGDIIMTGTPAGVARDGRRRQARMRGRGRRQAHRHDRPAAEVTAAAAVDRQRHGRSIVTGHPRL